jgi:hypothetical protein
MVISAGNHHSGPPVLLRTGRVSVVIRRLVHHSWYARCWRPQFNCDSKERQKTVINIDATLMS